MSGLPAELAQRQLDAYNAHDIDAFAACYAPDVEAYLLPEMSLILRGVDALRARYAPYFEAKRPHATVTDRKVLGAMALDVEAVRLADGTQMAAWALYHVDAGLIRRIWFVKG